MTTWIALFACATIYWLTRYQPERSLNSRAKFAEYAGAEWPGLITGFVGAAILYALYVYAAPQVLEVACKKWDMLCGVNLPAVNVVIAGLLGYCGKSFYDRLPRIMAWFGARVKLPGAKV